MKSKQIEAFKVGDLVINTIFEKFGNIAIDELINIEEETGVIFIKAKHYNYKSTIKNIRLATQKDIIKIKFKQIFKK